jgi:glutamate carboxypeptidase
MPTESEWIERSYEPILQDLRALVEIDCGTANKAGVDRAGSWVAERCAGWGWEVERRPQSDYGDVWLAGLRGRGRGRILLMGHLDTVYPEGTAAERPMRFAGEKLFGPGVCDMKGGLLVGMYALRALQQAGFSDFKTMRMCFNSEEEVGSPVSTSIYLPEAQQADAALVLEAARAGGEIVSARKGSGTFRLEVAGRAAHAGVEPEKGINAVVELGRRILDLQALNGIGPGVTVNVTRAGGGTVTNAIPESAWLDLDVRVADRDGLQIVQEALAEETRRPPAIPGARVRLEGAFHNPPMERTPAIAFLAGLAKETAGALGFQVDEAATGGASDANNVAEIGVPVLDGLGPVGGLDHSPDEYILPASILPRTRLLAGLIRRILAAREQLAALRG